MPLVVALHSHGVEPCGTVQNAAAIRAAADKISYEHDAVTRGDRSLVEELVQLARTPVNITNDQCAGHSGVTIAQRRG